MNWLKFNTEHQAAILNGTKRATLRFEPDRDLPMIGHPFKLVTETGSWIATSVCRDRGYESIDWIVRLGIEGHRDYSSVDECITHLQRYYPGAEMDAETCLEIVYWGDLLGRKMDYEGT